MICVVPDLRNQNLGTNRICLWWFVFAAASWAAGSCNWVLVVRMQVVLTGAQVVLKGSREVGPLSFDLGVIVPLTTNSTVTAAQCPSVEWGISTLELMVSTT